MVLGSFTAFLAWLLFRSESRWPRTALLIFGLIFIAWLTILMRFHLAGVGYDFGVLALPVLLLLLALKPTSLQDNEIAIRIAALAIVMAAAITFVLEPFGVTPSSFAVGSGGQRIGVLRDFGLDYRWFGPFIHSNLAGPLGGAVLILGLFSRGVVRLVLLTGGAAIMLFSGSRTGLVPLVLAVMLMIFLHFRTRPEIPWRIMRWFVPLLGFAAIIGYIIRFDPTMSERTYAWIDYANLFFSSPWSGVAQLGIEGYLETNSTIGNFAQPHAHNVLLDVAGRWGILPLVLTAAIFTLALMIGTRALKRSQPMGIVLIIYLIIVTLSETPFSWVNLNSFLTLFILAIAVSASDSFSSTASIAQVKVTRETIR